MSQLNYGIDCIILINNLRFKITRFYTGFCPQKIPGQNIPCRFLPPRTKHPTKICHPGQNIPCCFCHPRHNISCCFCLPGQNIPCHFCHPQQNIQHSDCSFRRPSSTIACTSSKCPSKNVQMKKLDLELIERQFHSVNKI